MWTNADDPQNAYANLKKLKQWGFFAEFVEKLSELKHDIAV